MSITRINEFKAQAGKRDALTKAFRTILPVIQAAKGCEHCELLLSDSDAQKLIIIEQWTDTVAHQAAAKHIDPKDFQAIMALLDGKPAGIY